MMTRSRRLREIRAAFEQVQRDARGDFPPATSIEQAQEFVARYHDALERYAVLLDRMLAVTSEGAARSAGKRNSERDAGLRNEQATWPVAEWLFAIIPRLRIGANKADVNLAFNLVQSVAAPVEVQQWVKRQPNGVTHANVKKLMQRWRGRKPARSQLTLRKPTKAELDAILGVSHIRISK